MFLCLQNRKKGFTLIELLVTIAIVGILTAVITASLSSTRAGGRDGKRIADMKQVQQALEIYFDQNGQYPLTLSDPLLSVFLATPPQQPISPISLAGHTDYTYIPGPSGCDDSSVRCKTFLLQVILETPSTALLNDSDTTNTATKMYDIKS